MPETFSDAPFHHDIAGEPDSGQPQGYALWASGADRVRIRLGLWPQGTPGGRGTVLLFPGRTEYLEKYGPTAAAFQARGYGVIAIDWRGQGLSDRPLQDRMTGHVGGFAEFQRDVALMLRAAEARALPKPWFLLSHSMGGCIALRSLLNGLDVKAAAFSAPMWGIGLPPAVAPVAWTLSSVAHWLAQGKRYVPSTGPVSYVMTAAERDNTLTSDPAMFRFMLGQVTAHPELALGGPSLSWLYAALRETKALAPRPSPALPCHVTMGAKESVVSTEAIRDRVNRWPGASLVLAPGAQHEIMMERPELRRAFLDRVCDLYDSAVKS